MAQAFGRPHRCPSWVKSDSLPSDVATSQMPGNGQTLAATPAKPGDLLKSLGPGSFEYERFRGFMTRDTNAAVIGALAAGATEVMVADSRGNGENGHARRTRRHVRRRHLHRLPRLNQQFAWRSSAQLKRVALNGVEATEGAASAGHFGAPEVFASCEDAAIEEITKGIEPIETFVTKKTWGFHSAENLMPAVSTGKIEAGVNPALGAPQ